MKISSPLVFITCLGFSQFSFSDASPWLASPGTFALSLTQIEQSADEFFIADQENPLAFDLSLSTTTLYSTYAVNDFIGIDVSLGYAKSTFDDAQTDSLTGTTDSKIGLTWQFINEYDSFVGLPSTAIRIGAIIEGDYDIGRINSIGDGGSGYETSLVTGKSLNHIFSLSAEAGYRDRNNDIPSENFYNISAYLIPLPALTAFISYRVDNSIDGLQISDSDFNPDRFPELEEDKEYIQLGAQYGISKQATIALSYAQVLDGRNTALSDVFAFNFKYQL